LRRQIYVTWYNIEMSQEGVRKVRKEHVKKVMAKSEGKKIYLTEMKLGRH
jgi:hypothetical protein